MITPRLDTMRLTTQLDPMLIPYMSRNIILSFNSLIPDLVASWNWTIHALVEVLHFMVAVQCLLSQKRGSPGTTRLVAEVIPPERMRLWLTTNLLGMNVLEYNERSWSL